MQSLFFFFSIGAVFVAAGHLSRLQASKVVAGSASFRSPAMAVSMKELLSDD
jgi:hypothetical protein